MCIEGETKRFLANLPQTYDFLSIIEPKESIKVSFFGRKQEKRVYLQEIFPTKTNQRQTDAPINTDSIHIEKNTLKA